MSTPAGVLSFWFNGNRHEKRAEWFQRSDSFDQACEAFRPAMIDARQGRLDTWADTPEGALALILLLDQLPRNLHRGSAEAFASDPLARAAARAAVARGFDREFGANERMFLYLPFEHSEALADQETSLRLFGSLRPALGDATVDYAVRHHAVISRFERFPHRNALLGRETTDAEAAWLQAHPKGF